MKFSQLINEIENDFFGPQKINFYKVYHGTNLKSALNIKENGIDFSFSKPIEVHGTGFYTSNDFLFIKDNYSITRGQNNPVIVEFKVSNNINVLDFRFPKDLVVWKNFKEFVHKPNFNILMNENNIDAIYDERFKSFVVYNPDILKFSKIIEVKT